MDLQAIINDLLKQVDALKVRIASLEQENTLLRQENAQLRCENESLKERLGLNSQNSSLPPSRDLYRAKKNTRPPSGKKPGGQPGHKFRGYQPQIPDKVVDVFPERCVCGHCLEIAPTFRAKQKIDISPIKPYVTE
jgi:transposase